MDEEYRRICDKLGFEPCNYKPELLGTEDDSKENPFARLSVEEIDYLWANGYLSN